MSSSQSESITASSKTPMTVTPLTSTPNQTSTQTESANFAKQLDDIQRHSSLPATNFSLQPSRWSALNFLTTAPRTTTKWPWTYASLGSDVRSTPLTKAPSNSSATFVDLQPSAAPSIDALNQPINQSTSSPWKLSSYPRPVNDNGRGVHWIPTVKQTTEEVDRFVQEAIEMGMKWVLFLNDGSNIGQNDYLVDQLTKSGIEPIMRIYTPGLVPLDNDIAKMVRHYKSKGVNYYQLYNEPNLMVETAGQFPDVEHYLDLWAPAAQQVIDAGGLPGFGALSPQGEFDDRSFLRQALNSLNQRGQGHLLNQGWLSMHNYTGPRPLNDPDGFLRFQQYNQIIEAALGRSLPIIGTEGGTHLSPHVTEEQQIDMVTNAYKYMKHREPYNFAYTYWILANGHDPAWAGHALIRPEGPTPLAKALKKLTV